MKLKFETYEHTNEDGDTSTIKAHRVTDEEARQDDNFVNTTGGPVQVGSGSVVVDNGGNYYDVLAGPVWDSLEWTEQYVSPPASSSTGGERDEHGDPIPPVSRAEFESLTDRVAALEENNPNGGQHESPDPEAGHNG